MMKKLRVDTGAIKFVLAGANIMCPGLTSEGATMHSEVRAPALLVRRTVVRHGAAQTVQSVGRCLCMCLRKVPR